MKSRSLAPVITALLLVLTAGTTVPANAQTPAYPAREPASISSTVDFRSSHWLSDRKVVNNNNEEIANVSDLIVDRGSGRIEYIVIKTGTTLGMGGRAVAIPFGAFRWETGKDRFILASTPEQLKQFPEYTPEGWKAMMATAKDDKSTLRQRLAADAASPSDPYAGNLDTAKKARVEGEITKVERVRTSTFGEQVVVDVQAKDGPARRIALGPSWFINGTLAAPMRGDKVVVDTLALPRDRDQLLVGTELRTGDRELHLRDSDGTPAWTLKAVESGGHNYSTPYSRFLPLSQLPGMKIDCRGDELGKVHDIILDRNSGEIGFICIDPNQNFLGIGDTKRLVPWSVTTVTLDGKVRIDASKEMVLASPETPSDLSTLNTGTTPERAYNAYNVPVPRFEAPKPLSVNLPAKDNAWSADGSVIGAIERDSAKTIEGKVIEFTEVKFEMGVQSARALKIKMAGDANEAELVLLGPAWYMDNQKPVCKAGDTIKVEACRTRIDGHRYWMAKSVECKDARIVLLDKSNSPAWAKP
ncbi:MAG: PRC-barrel domain-containing protein [Phycisphaerales bacterium]